MPSPSEALVVKIVRCGSIYSCLRNELFIYDLTATADVPSKLSLAFDTEVTPSFDMAQYLRRIVSGS